MDTPTVNWFSATRELKNAKYLQKVAPHIMPEVEPLEGFGSIIPHNLLAQLHKPDGRDTIGRDAHLVDLLKNIKFPAIDNKVSGPLFSGTLYFVHVNFIIQDQNYASVSISDSDIATILKYANLATTPISQYADQYGPNSVAVSQAIIYFTVRLSSARYNDAQVTDWVNSIVSQNGLPSNSCVVVLNPQGVVNTDADPAKGTEGYHGAADVPYICANVGSQYLTLKDPHFAYAGVISHEIAEMVVDPYANLANPEVCDPCGPNCASTFLSYFDNDGNYIATSQAFPPDFDYNFFINGIVHPRFATQCPPSNLNRACNYGGPVEAQRQAALCQQLADELAEIVDMDCGDPRDSEAYRACEERRKQLMAAKRVEQRNAGCL